MLLWLLLLLLLLLLCSLPVGVRGNPVHEASRNPATVQPSFLRGTRLSDPITYTDTLRNVNPLDASSFLPFVGEENLKKYFLNINCIGFHSTN